MPMDAPHDPGVVDIEVTGDLRIAVAKLMRRPPYLPAYGDQGAVDNRSLEVGWSDPLTLADDPDHLSYFHAEHPGARVDTPSGRFAAAQTEAGS